MKKQLLCLMIAGLSLFALPYELKAGTPALKENSTEVSAPPTLTPAMEKKIDNFKKKHPDMFSKKENKEQSTSNAAGGRGGVYYISGTALVLIIVLLIILL